MSVQSNPDFHTLSCTQFSTIHKALGLRYSILPHIVPRRILRQWFGTSRIGSTGKPNPDGLTGSEAIEIFTYSIPKKILAELEQAEKACGNDLIPWIIFGPKGGRDENMLMATKLKYFAKPENKEALQLKRERMEKSFANASINRELAALKRMIHLGAQCTPPKVNLVPYIPMLKESNVRKRFFEPDEHKALKDALPEELKPVVTFAYHSGWRKAEILGLTWDKVDLKRGFARLDPGETKNEEGRIFYLNEELMTELKILFSQRRLDCPYVFQRDGKLIKDFGGAWKSACIEAGLLEVVRDARGNETKVSSRILHDFRRTAIKDIVRSGIPERVAMKISGHRTRSVFDRYNIVSDQDLKEAALKKQACHEKQNVAVEGDQKRGEVIPFKQAQNE